VTPETKLKGDKGDKGDTGATALQGLKGDKGDKGDTGAEGPQGPKGDPGDDADVSALQAQIDELEQRIDELEGEPIPPMPPMQPTPISSYEFENNVLDSTGTNDGTVVGNTQFTTGKVGNNAFDFDGSSFIRLANESNFDFDRTDEFSIAFWIKQSAGGVPIAKNAGSSSAGYQVILSGSTFIFRISDSARNTFDISTSYTSGVFEHFVLTYDGSSDRSGMKIYKNGSLVVTGTASAISNTILNNDVFGIGARSNGANKLTGQMDDVRIFDLELTAEKVAMLAGI